MKYLVVIEKADSNYSAFSPDIPGCITIGDTIEETRENMKVAILISLEYDMEKGNKLPDPMGLQQYINAGVFEDTNIDEDYFITQVEVELPKLAHL